MARSRASSRRQIAALLAIFIVCALLPLPAHAAEWIAPGTAVTVTSAEPVLLRLGPGYDSEATSEVASGSQVVIVDGPVTAADGSVWYQVDVWGQPGYLPDYAVAMPVDPAATGDPAAADPAPAADPAAVAAPPAQPAPADPGAVQPAGAPIANAQISFTNGDGAVCRSAPSYDASELAVLPEATVVDVTGYAVGDWQPINCAGVGGYVNVGFVNWDLSAVAPVVPAGPAASDPALATSNEQGRGKRDHGGGGGGGGSSTGQAIVNFAMQYEGYPYVAAGEGPSAFDCSGFTKFVVLSVTGMDISHDMATQISMGTPVDRGSLQPGDLVFFQNTYKRGLSHAGIYIGGGQFIHAENESTGVRVSNINDDYYASRWYGAVRYW